MAYHFTVGFEEPYFILDGNTALHIRCTADEAAFEQLLYTFRVTVSSTSGKYSQSFSAEMPRGSTAVSIPFVPPLAWADDFAVNLGDLAHEDACGAFSAVMEADVTSYSGTNKYQYTFKGYQSSLYATVAAELLPSVGPLTVTAVDGRVPEDWGVWVQGISVADIACPEAAGAYGSKIIAYYFGDGTARTQNSCELRLTQSGTVTVPVTVEDSRLRRVTKDLLLTVQPYTAPALSGIASRRCGADGAEAEEGAYFTAACTPAGSTLDGRNPLAVTVAWKAVTAADYGSPVALVTPAGQLVDAGLQKGASYQLRYTVADAFYTVDYYDYLSSTVYLLHFLKGGTGIAVGKAAEQSNLFDVALPTALRRDVQVGGSLAVAGGLSLNGTDVGAALADLGTRSTAAFTLDTALVEETLENSILRSGPLVMYRLQCFLSFMPYEGESYCLGSVPAGWYSAEWPPVILALQNANGCKGWIDTEGKVYLQPANDGYTYTELYGFGIL